MQRYRMSSNTAINTAWVSNSAALASRPAGPLFPSFVPLQQPKAYSLIVSLKTESPATVEYLNPQCAPANFTTLYKPPVDLKYV